MGKLIHPMKAPNFTTHTLNNKKLTLESLRGKVVVVDFWATWCGPCRDSIPELISMRKTFHSQPFEIVGLSRDDANTVDSVKPFAKAYHINYQIGVTSDANIAAAAAYSAEALPMMVIIDKRGYMRYVATGYSPEFKPVLTKWIGQLLKEKR